MMIGVPDPADPWPAIWEFALTYNAYDRHGGFEGSARLGNQAVESWRSAAALPNDLEHARAALFFEQRRFRHFGSDPTGSDERYIRALVERICELCGGTLPGSADPPP